MIDLTQVELFEFQLIFHMEDRIVDLHNDYKCETIIYDFEKQLLRCSFIGELRIFLDFGGASVKKINVLFERTLDSSTLNSFYRGRFEQNGNLLEFTEDGKGYYYLEFENGDSFELHSSKVLLYSNG